MIRGLFIIASFLGMLGFSPIEATNDEVCPYSIKSSIIDDKLQVNISLFNGLEFPAVCTIHENDHFKMCDFAVKIIDGTLFSNSEGYPLSKFRMIVHATNDPEANSVTLVVKAIMENIERGWFLNNITTTTKTFAYRFEGIQLNISNKPDLFRDKVDFSLGWITFDIISTE